MDINILEQWILRVAAMVGLIIGLARFVDHEVRLLLHSRHILVTDHRETARQEMDPKSSQQDLHTNE